MLGIDAEVATLPMPMPGQNMKGLINRRAGPHRVINELERKGREQKDCCRKVERPFVAGHRSTAHRNRLHSVVQKRTARNTQLQRLEVIVGIRAISVCWEGLIRLKANSSSALTQI